MHETERVTGGDLVDVQVFPDEARAVRAACTLEWHAAVTPHGRASWAVVRVRGAFRDDQRVIDGMRELAYSEWDAAYVRLLAKHPPTARFTARGVVSTAVPRGVKEPRKHTVARGIVFWRVYFGAPDITARRVLAEHMAKKDLWALERTGAIPGRSSYAAHVRRLTVDLAAEYARWLHRQGRTFDAGRIEAAFPKKGRAHELPVYLLPHDSHLDGALYPRHSTRDEPPTTADLDDNRRVIAVKHFARDSELLALLAHEIAHALFPPVWQRENHPPAFADANEELRVLVGLRDHAEKKR
jgi:hypothetical protein